VVADDDDVKISGGRSQFSVRPLSLDDYPRAAGPGVERRHLGRGAFGDALRQVVRAASTDEARPILTGVLLTAENDGLRLVATDSYRLAVRDLPGVSVLAPTRRCWSLGEHSQELPASARFRRRSHVRSASGDATFEVGTTRLTTRLIEGEFPNYRQLIPQSHPEHAHRRAATRCSRRSAGSRSSPRDARRSGCRSAPTA
jgi:DNA polymerase-3 subunit beta